MLVALAGAVLAVLVLAQVLLPRIAADRVSSRSGRYGSVASVSVSAWPALTLLWGHADSIRVRARRLALAPAQAVKLLSEAHGITRLDVAVERVRIGRLALTGATLRKRGPRLRAAARASEAAVGAALPQGVSVRLLRSGGGQVVVRTSGGLFGAGAGLDAVARANEGKLVLQPVGFLVGRLRLTLFADPRVYVEAIGASRQAADPASYRLSMRARLR
jgi:hypothetical protein